MARTGVRNPREPRCVRQAPAPRRDDDGVVNALRRGGVTPARDACRRNPLDNYRLGRSASHRCVARRWWCSALSATPASLLFALLAARPSAAAGISDTGSQQTAQAPNPMAMLFPFAMMFLIFYLIVFRPQSKARKELEQMVKNLKKSDEVVTSGGIFGVVVNVKPDAITLRIDDNVRIDVEPSAIARLVKRKAESGDATTTEKRS